MAANAAEAIQYAWTPQPGPQTLLLSCPLEEIFYGGARGGGKTDGLLGLFAKHAELNGRHARGVIFRRSYPEFEELEARSREIYPLLGARYHASQKTWHFPNGAWLRLRYIEKDKDADRYQGHSYTFVGFDELGGWGTPAAVDKLRACLRSPHGVPCQLVATGNPGGVGHSWVKDRYIIPAPPGQPFTAVLDDGTKVQRVYIPARVDDNRMLVENDPKYIDRIKASGPPWLVRAWLKGDWNVAPGAYLEGLWDPDRHVCRPFPIPMHWPRWRSLDWGVRAPYSVGWYTRSPDDVIYRYRELYGWGGKPNVGTRQDASVVAQAIKDIEAPERKMGVTFHNSPADTQIWQTSGTGIVVNDRFISAGVIWVESEKGPGSRVNGAHELVARLHDDAFVVWDNNKHFLRTVPSAVPDDTHPEDFDTDQEDHVIDEVRYSIMSRRMIPREPPAERTLPKPSAPLNGESRRPANLSVPKHGSIIDTLMGR